MQVRKQPWIVRLTFLAAYLVQESWNNRKEIVIDLITGTAICSLAPDSLGFTIKSRIYQQSFSASGKICASIFTCTFDEILPFSDMSMIRPLGNPSNSINFCHQVSAGGAYLQSQCSALTNFTKDAEKAFKGHNRRSEYHAIFRNTATARLCLFHVLKDPLAVVQRIVTRIN